VETNQVTIVGAPGPGGQANADTLPLMSKAGVASAILDRVERLLTAATAPA
jgi:hypothetical protein